VDGDRFDSPFAHVPQPGAEHDPCEIVQYPRRQHPLGPPRRSALTILACGLVILIAGVACVCLVVVLR
jgi:hypothetical protein